jgi:hypothetical protein
MKTPLTKSGKTMTQDVLHDSGFWKKSKRIYLYDFSILISYEIRVQLINDPFSGPNYTYLNVRLMY